MKAVLLCLLVIFTAVQVSADDVFESNILGMKLKKITGIYDSESGYALEVSRTSEGESRRLYKAGELVSTIRIENRDGLLTEITEKDGETGVTIRQNGVITSETRTAADGVQSRTEYSYRDGRLEYADYFTNEQKDFRDRYSYTSDGRLLDVRRTYSDGINGILIAFVFNEGRLSRYWYSGADQKNYVRFNKYGIVFSDMSAAGNFRETREYSYSDSGEMIEEIMDLNTGTVSRLYYDSGKRISRSTETDSEGKLLEQSSWEYSGDLLAEMRIKRDLSLEIFRYEYYDDESLAGETYLKNGIILQVTEYSDEDNYTETLYRSGIPSLRIVYEDGMRVNTIELQE